MTSSYSPLSFGLVDGRPVFMDDQADSYFRLDADAEAEFLTVIGGGNGSAQPSDLLPDTLGLPPEQSAVEARCVQPATSLLERCGACRPTLGDIMRATLILHSAKRSLAREPVGQILARLTSTGVAETGSVAGRQVPLAKRFLTARRLVPVRTNCLLDSIAILKWLGPESAGASLVFAVKLDPFAAHCWVQNDQLLINDVLDTVASFTPVRVIRCSVPGR